MRSRSTLRSHFWQSAANYVQNGAGLVMGVLLARLLHPEDYGQYGFATAAVGLAVLPAAWTLAPQVLADGAREPVVISDALRFADRVVLAKLGLGLAACLWLLLSAGALSALIGLVSLFPLLAGDYVGVLRAAMESHGNFKGNFLDSLLSVGATAALSIPLALTGFGVWALALPGIPLVMLQVALFQRLTGLSWRPVKPASGRSYAKSGFLIWLSGAAEQALGRMDRILLGSFSNEAELGNYNRAFNYTLISVRVLNSLVANPTVTALARAGSGEAKRRLIAKTAAILLSASFLTFAVFWWFSDTLIPLVFGEQWREAIPAFQAMAPMGLVVSFTYLPVTVLIAAKRYKALAFARVVTLALFVAACFALAAGMDSSRMAWIVQGALFVQGLFFWGASVKELRK